MRIGGGSDVFSADGDSVEGLGFQQGAVCGGLFMGPFLLPFFMEDRVSADSSSPTRYPRIGMIYK